MDSSSSAFPSQEQGGFDRHPLSSAYSMEVEMDVVSNHLELYGNSLKQKAARKRSRLALSLVFLGTVLLVGAAFNKVAHRSSSEDGSGRATLSSSSSHTYGHVPPPPPKHMEITCGAPNVKTLLGAQACENICNAARCCTETCFLENKETCMQYHESCQILDGVVAATGEIHELPKDYDGGWFEMDHFLTNIRGKKVLPVETGRPNDQLKREEACEEHNTRHGLKECVRLCMPAGCCYSQQNIGADLCHAPSGVQVDCRHYHDCNVLYHMTP